MTEFGEVTAEAPFYAELQRHGPFQWMVMILEWLPAVAARGYPLDCANHWVGTYWVTGRKRAERKARRQIRRRNEKRQRCNRAVTVAADGERGSRR